MTNQNVIKIVKKSEHWHKHGKHASPIGYIREQERLRFSKPVGIQFDSVRECLADFRRNRQ